MQFIKSRLNQQQTGFSLAPPAVYLPGFYTDGCLPPIHITPINDPAVWMTLKHRDLLLLLTVWQHVVILAPGFVFWRSCARLQCAATGASPARVWLRRASLRHTGTISDSSGLTAAVSSSSPLLSDPPWICSQAPGCGEKNVWRSSPLYGFCARGNVSWLGLAARTFSGRILQPWVGFETDLFDVDSRMQEADEQAEGKKEKKREERRRRVGARLVYSKGGPFIILCDRVCF